MNILRSLGFIVGGIVVIIYTCKHPNQTFPAHTIGGYMAGIGFIILGIMLLMGTITL